MNFRGHLYGLKAYTSEYCVERSTAFTRKQTRKFKNHRWVKKYLKKYSYEVQTPSMVKYHDKIIMHPEIYIKLKKEIDGQEIQRNDRQGECGLSAIGMGRRMILAQPY